MSRTRAVRDSLQQAACRLCPATAADNDAPESGRIALHGHG
ncbi:hypothetical protein OHA71_07335 [Streptomyces sp. NBC_00444]